MIVNSSLPPMRQSASSGTLPANTKDPSGDRTPQDFDAIVKNGNLPLSSGGSASGENEISAALFVVNTATQTYAVETIIGDSAVSFDARAIIGPVGAAPDGPSEISVSIAEPGSGLEQQVAAQSTTKPPVLQTGTVTSTAANHQPAGLAALGSGASIANHHPRTPLANVQNALLGSRGSVGPLQTSMAENRSTPRTGAPANLPPPTAARGANFAALVAALPQEVRVTVRGMMLEPSEREELAREIRTALAGHGLDHRPIHIISGQGTI